MAKLRVHNIESGPASSDVALGISGDTIAVSSDSLKLNTWKDSGGNTLFQSDGAGTLSNVNSSFSGAGPHLISTGTPSAVSTFEITSGLDSTYDVYKIVFLNMDNSADNTWLGFQGSTNGGSSYGVNFTTAVYKAVHNIPNSIQSLAYDHDSDNANESSAYQMLINVTYPGPPDVYAGEFWIYQPSNTTYAKQFYSRFTGFVQENMASDCYVSGYFNTTSAIDGIQFKPASGTMSGTIKLYGID